MNPFLTPNNDKDYGEPLVRAETAPGGGELTDNAFEPSFAALEFDLILEKLAARAVSAAVRERCLNLMPSAELTDIARLTDETTQAKTVIEKTGAPPLALMAELPKVIAYLAVESMLTCGQIMEVAAFCMSSRRMKDYLKRAEPTDTDVAFYGRSIVDLSQIEDEIERSIRNERVDDRASQKLYDLRRSIGVKEEQIKTKLEALLRKNTEYYSESFVAVRNGRFTLPVKKEWKSRVDGALVGLSNTGGTCFIEPAAVRRMQDELNELTIEEDAEVRRILYALTALIYDHLPSIKLNVEAMETLDFIFAKAKLSLDMRASPINLVKNKAVRLISARHPLLDFNSVVPLDFTLGDVSGIVVTGPNTGGKTVALKTVGLLALMAQSGLHVPAGDGSAMCAFDKILCDIGDGQSITENLSTFSSRITNITGILRRAGARSLVLLDELGSGTDPAEGMGIAMAILEDLLRKRCLFAATTHYPEIKEFAAHTPGLTNARMAFDKESLAPLYRLEIGEAGESCALYIAERLGFPKNLVARAREITYAGYATANLPDFINETPAPAEFDVVKKHMETATPRVNKFNPGDSVLVYPQRDIGVVFDTTGKKGEIGVLVKGRKLFFNHKRLKLKVAADQLYPDDYDFSIVFDSVATRKARRVMDKKHVEGNVIVVSEPADL